MLYKTEISKGVFTLSGALCRQSVKEGCCLVLLEMLENYFQFQKCHISSSGQILCVTKVAILWELQLEKGTHKIERLFGINLDNRSYL